MSYIYFLAFLNVLLAVVMLIYNWKLNRNIVHFSVFLLAVSATSVLFDTVLNGGSPYILLYGSVFFVSFSFYAAPSLFLFVRGLVTDRVVFERKDLIHMIPMLVSLVLLLPFLFRPQAVQLEFAANSLENISYYMSGKLYFLPVWFHEIMQISIALSYLFTALYLLNRKFKNKRSGLLSEIRQQYNRSRFWLNVILIVSVILVILRIGLVLYFLEDPAHYEIAKNEYQFAISSLVNTALTLLVMLNPRLMYGFPQSKALRSEEADVDTDIQPELLSDEAIQAKAPVQNEYFTTLCKRIQEEMEDSKPYLMPEFNVYHLTISLDAPQHHIQFCISNIMNKKFADFKGEYRVKHAMRLMKTEMHKRNTLATIAYESGFASATSFYTTFREITGITPNQWIKENT